ncbi:MAG TPA: hypothetical protein VF343_00475 [Syntrophales bacterium]
MRRKFVLLPGLILSMCLIAGCAAKARSQVAVVYKETGFANPGSYHLKFLLDGQGTLAEYLLNEKSQNPDLQDFDAPGLEKLFRISCPQLYLPVQPGVSLCNLDTNFKHCKGLELLVDFETYADDTVVLHSSVLYHVKIRLEGDESNFFRTAKAQRDRGEFALPRHYYIGALIEAIQKALPILQEIATDYPKYIKDDNQEIEIEVILEEAPERSAAKKADQDMKDTAGLSGGVIVSALPNMSLLAGFTVSALNSGGRTFWQVLKEEKDFDLYKGSLDLKEVNFSYTESSARNFLGTFLRLFEPPPDILIRKIVIRLREKEQEIQTRQGNFGRVLYDEQEK